jgi:biotin carboxyl carrier protein
MNYNIKIGDKSFEVTIDDINKRPIVAHVNGQEILVSPELKTSANEPTIDQPYTLKQPIATDSRMQSNTLIAPLPGTVIEVFVKPGDEIETGQVVLIIEAMKMKNSIRSTKDGLVSKVLVSAGQTVAHKQALVEFQE